MLASAEQYVRWYWCMFEFEYVIAWHTMHYDIIAIVHLPAIQLQWLCVMLIEYMQRYCIGFGRTESALVLVHV